MRWSLAGFVFVAACECGASAEHASRTERTETSPETSRIEWLKGQLHMHTAFSGDSETPLDDALAWYAEHDYDFVVVTDHNHVTVGSHADMLVLPGVELTQNLRRCIPEPAPGHSCLLHVNALVVSPEHEGHLPLRTFGIPARLEVYQQSIERSAELGGIAQLNHPNFHRAADADLLAALTENGLRLFELANEAVDSENEGPPSTEAIWDDVLSRGHRLWGTATDDAHHYQNAEAVRATGNIAHVGNRGWVVVRASRDAGSIRRALREGDFYASNGVTLDTLETEGELRIETAEPHTFELIGRGGESLGTEHGSSLRFSLDALPVDGYVRCVVRDAEGRRAWTQPVFRNY